LRLVKRAIEEASAAEKRRFLWDDQLPGFGVVIHPSGRKAFCIQYRTRAGRSRRMNLGAFGVLTVQQARRRATEALGIVAAGGDPLAERRAEQTGDTVADLAERYLAEHAVKKKSGDEDRRKLEADILPRVLALLRKMFGLAEQWDLRPLGSNPVQYVKKYREQARERYLSHEELAAFGAALDALEAEDERARTAVAALRLLALTGARRNEVLALRWEWLDEEHRCFWLPDSKTGARPLRLEEPASDLLRSLPRRSEWVFPSRRTGGHIVDVRKVLGRAIAKANEGDGDAGAKKGAGERVSLRPFRVHDLRHTKASVAVGMGFSLPVTGALLGHARASTTERYAHLAADPVRSAEGKVQARIAAAMSGQNGSPKEVKRDADS